MRITRSMLRLPTTTMRLFIGNPSVLEDFGAASFGAAVVDPRTRSSGCSSLRTSWVRPSRMRSSSRLAAPVPMASLGCATVVRGGQV